MDVADDRMAHIAAHTLNGLSDDSGAKMAHMERLRHIGPAVVHDHRLRMLRRLQPQLLPGPHPVHIIGQEAVPDLQIDKAGHYCGNFLKDLAVL